jgi:hypothetical protein
VVTVVAAAACEAQVVGPGGEGLRSRLCWAAVVNLMIMLITHIC